MQKYAKHVLEEPVASTVISHRFSHAVWGAIFSGFFVILVTQTALALLGSSIGFSTLNITQGNNIKALGIGAVIWWIVSGCISFYVGGLVAGRLSGIPRQVDGMLHGLVAFSMTTIFMFLFLTTSLGAVMAGSLGLLNSGAKAVSSVAPQIASTAQAVVPQDVVNSDINNTKNQVRQIMEKIQDPQQRQALKNSLMAMASTDNPDAQKQQAVNILTQSANMDQAEAQQTVNDWSQNIQTVKQNLQQTAQKAEDTAQKASHAAGGMAFAGFIMLVLGAFFAGLGGRVGAPHWSDQEIA